MKLKEFGPPGGGARPKFYYVDPPLLLLLSLTDATKTWVQGQIQCEKVEFMIKMNFPTEVYETLFYNVICDFTSCVGGGIYE